MATRWKQTTAVCLLASVILAGVAVAGLRGGVLGNGGAPCSGSGYKVNGTMGQAAVGFSAGSSGQVSSGYWSYGGVRVIAVDPPGVPPSLPREFAFGRAYPNPALGTASFSLALPKEAEVSLEVYDVAGRQVGEPFVEKMAAGVHTLSWHAPGNRAGVYFARLRVDKLAKGDRRFVVIH